MLNKSNFLKVLLLFSVLSLVLFVRSYTTVNVQAIGGDDAALYLPIAIKAEAPPTPTPTPSVPTFPADPASVFYVATSGSDAGNCSEAAPCQTIQKAVSVVKSNGNNNNNLIKVAQGTYSSAGASVVDIIFAPGETAKNMTIRGGYTAGNWNATSGNADSTVIHGQDARRGILIASVPSVNVAIENLTVQNAFVNIPVANTGEYMGGGLLCTNDNPNEGLFVNVSLSYVIFKSNVVQGVGDKATGGGGAAFYFRCHATLDHVTFDSNRVQAANDTDNTRGGQALGGGLLMTSGDRENIDHPVTLRGTNLTFTNNEAYAGDGGIGKDSVNSWLADALGGGASFQRSDVNIEGITASNNKVGAGDGSQFGGYGNGGGLFFEFATGHISNGTINDNEARGGHSESGQPGVGGGGAIMATDAELTLNRLTMLNNHSFGGNGTNAAGHAGGGAMYFTDNTFAAPAMKVVGTNLIMANNVTEAGQGEGRYGGGGGIFSQDTTLTLSHVTMVNNRMLNSMQGTAIVSLHNAQDASYQTSISYSIIADHQERDIHQNPMGPIIAQKQGDNLTLRSVLFDNNTRHYSSDNCAECGQYYGWQWWLPQGPPTFDVSNLLEGDSAFVGASSENYHIGANSAAIDKATGSNTPDDIDGESRPQGSAPDLGADEYSGGR